VRAARSARSLLQGAPVYALGVGDIFDPGPQHELTSWVKSPSPRQISPALQAAVGGHMGNTSPWADPPGRRHPRSAMASLRRRTRTHAHLSDAPFCSAFAAPSSMAKTPVFPARASSKVPAVRRTPRYRRILHLPTGLRVGVQAGLYSRQTWTPTTAEPYRGSTANRLPCSLGNANVDTHNANVDTHNN
jgi:hypothetical protein